MPTFDADAVKALLAAGGEKIASLIKTRAGGFLNEKLINNEFLKERGARLFELGIELAKADDETERARILDSIEVVKDGITSECFAVATDASLETRDIISTVINTARDFAIQVLPIAAKVLLAGIL